MKVTTEQQALADEIREQNVLYESGNVDQAFWIGQQNRLKTLRATDPKLSQKALGKLVGKDDSWVQRVLAWDAAAPQHSPFARVAGETERKDRHAARTVLAERPTEVAAEIAKAMEDPEVAQAVAAEASQKALGNVDIAASTESYMRKRAATKPPPADAASHQLGGIGPGAMAEKIHNESMEPAITRIIGAFWSARQRWTQHGFRLALTEPHEFDELDKTVTEIGRLYAEMLDLYDAAKVAKLANEAEGIAS